MIDLELPGIDTNRQGTGTLFSSPIHATVFIVLNFVHTMRFSAPPLPKAQAAIKILTSIGTP